MGLRSAIRGVRAGVAKGTSVPKLNRDERARVAAADKMVHRERDDKRRRAARKRARASRRRAR